MNNWWYVVHFAFNQRLCDSRTLEWLHKSTSSPSIALELSKQRISTQPKQKNQSRQRQCNFNNSSSSPACRPLHSLIHYPAPLSPHPGSTFPANHLAIPGSALSTGLPTLVKFGTSGIPSPTGAKSPSTSQTVPQSSRQRSSLASLGIL